MWEYNYPAEQDELYHYGVLGMRWGVRRARKMLQKSKTLRKKGQTDKAKALEERSKKKLAIHEKLSGGKKVIDYVDKLSTGKVVAQSLLMDTYGALKYNQLRAKDNERGESIVAGLLYGAANRATGGLLSLVEPRVETKGVKNYIRNKILK